MENELGSSFQVLWEDNDFIVVSKPVGLLVDAGNGSDDLVRRVRASESSRASVFAFHRLDRETSGVVLMGKTRRYARDVTKLFEEKRIRKAYLAVVNGEWPITLGRVDTAIENRPASTTFRRLVSGTFGGSPRSLIEALPKTGRTHQIRLHCSGEGYAILGDERYGSVRSPQNAKHGVGQALHAYRLDFRHPANGVTISVRSEPTLWRETWLADFDGGASAAKLDTIWKKLFEGVAK